MLKECILIGCSKLHVQTIKLLLLALIQPSRQGEIQDYVKLSLGRSFKAAKLSRIH